MIPILAYVLDGIAIAISVLTRAFPLYYNLLINKMIEKIVLNGITSGRYYNIISTA